MLNETQSGQHCLPPKAIPPPHDLQGIQKYSNYTILKHTRRLIQENATLGEWQLFESSINWDALPRRTLRIIALEIYNHPHGQSIFHIALHKQVLRAKDFSKITKNWQNVSLCSTEKVMHFAYSAACQEGWDLIAAAKLRSEFANAGYPSFYAIKNM